jgi:hypothetical protein
MTTISQEFNQLERAISQTLASHSEHLDRQQKQIECLNQLLNSSKNGNLDAHCLSAMNRLIELLDSNQQSQDRVHSVLKSLTQAKDAQNLTIDPHGKIATCLKVELAELARRLGVNPLKLSAATKNPTTWSNLMAKYPDPDGYEWQLPGSKWGFYYKTHLLVTGTKAVKLEPVASLN